MFARPDLPTRPLTALLLTSCLLLAGCIERKEHLTLDPDGWVHVEVTLSADSFDELYLGDAVPSVDRGWLVEDWIEMTEDDEEVFRLRAEQSFAPDERIADHYGGLMDQYSDVVLHFPTERVIEDRKDGTYYHFHRVYEPRLWAHLETPRQQIAQQVRELVGDRDLTELPVAEQRTVLQWMARFEEVKFMTFARAAYLETTPDAPQDIWLSVSAEVEQIIASLDYQGIAKLMMADPDDPDVTAALEAEADAIQTRALGAMEEILRDSGWYPHAEVVRFRQRFEKHRMDYDITRDLGDDNFEIKVTMPGDIVGHNGDRVAGDTVTWSFTGKMLRDRRIEMMVTSVVWAEE